MNTVRELTKLSNGEELDIEYPIRLYDKDGNEVYYESAYQNNYWWKRVYQDGFIIYSEESDGNWFKCEYKDGKQVYHENSKGEWYKQEWSGNEKVYYENLDGVIIDRR